MDSAPGRGALSAVESSIRQFPIVLRLLPLIETISPAISVLRLLLFLGKVWRSAVEPVWLARLQIRSCISLKFSGIAISGQPDPRGNQGENFPTLGRSPSRRVSCLKTQLGLKR